MKRIYLKGEDHPFYGKKHNSESKQKMREAKKDYIPWNKGKNMCEETKEKLRISLKNIMNKPEIKNKISGKNNHGYGKKHTEDHIEKIRQARLHQKFPFKNSKPERFIQSVLSVNGIGYRTHEPILGQPDIFIEPNICVFVDGCYWHCCEKHGKGIYTERIIRDEKVNNKLKDQGYKVIRIWEHEINSDIMGCLNKIRGTNL